MNKRIALFSAAVLLCACGSSFKPTYTPAAKGTTTGTAATQMIDGTGGTVTSSDGRLEVIVPAGMFTTATEVGIQPITNTAPNGVGVAYRLTPEGTTFSQPVTVKFHLDATQMMGLDSTFVATQHADGLWYSQPHQTRDASATTVSVPAKHFSDWTISNKLIVTPEQSRVKVMTNATFRAMVVLTKDGNDLAKPSGDTEVKVPDARPLEGGELQGEWKWQVNLVTGGDSTNGTIASLNDYGNFTAPKVPPTPAKVTVSFKVESNDLTLAAGAVATIYSSSTLTWTGNSHVTGPDGATYDATFTFMEISDDGHGKHQYNVSGGHVAGFPPALLPNGCTESFSPSDQAMGPGDGMMTATYDPNNPMDNSPMISGMGTTVWQATYTTMCPNGMMSLGSAVQAEWWPLQLGSPPTPIKASGGVINTPISGGGFSGTLQLSSD